MEIQWYPGHMTRAKRQMQEDLKIIDLIIELVDARIPRSSRNPDIAELGKGKARLIVLNKADLADGKVTDLWISYFKQEKIQTVTADSRNRTDLKSLRSQINIACKEKIERNIRRGFRNRPIRAMVAGIPNVGKSTFINTVAGRASAKTGNRPGVTKGKQWIHLGKGLDLLDTPGILWPKFDDPAAGTALALTGAIRQDLLNREELALELIRFLDGQYPGTLERYFSIEGQKKPVRILEEIARARGCVTKGNTFSTEKASKILLDDFRNGLLGRISLERPWQSG
ncbi:MAG: ribosome biogenesis GTPase YlqF [Bilifractor sp.]|jgi:ribosome biogenesis GTPase A